MASCEEGQQVPLQQSSSLDQGHPSFSGQAGGRGGRKILLGTLVGVLLVAVLAAVCAVAAVSSPHPNTSDQPHTVNAAAAVAKAGRSEHRGQERRIFGQRYRNRRVAPSPVPSSPPPIDAGMSNVLHLLITSRIGICTGTLPRPVSTTTSSSSDGSCISRETEMVGKLPVLPHE